MSRVTGNGVRIGESNTQTNNFSLETDVNGKLTLHKGNVGNNLGTILESDATSTIVKTTDVQFGNSNTATNNFHLTTDGAGGCTLYRGNAGTVSTPVLSVDAGGNVTASKGMLTNGHAQVVANQTGITTAVDLTGMSVTVNVLNNQRIKITAKIAQVGNTVSTDATYLFLMEGATQLDISGKVLGTDTPSLSVGAVLTPSVGSHTYKLAMSRAGTGTVTAYAGATSPAFILVEAI